MSGHASMVPFLENGTIPGGGGGEGEDYARAANVWYFILKKLNDYLLLLAVYRNMLNACNRYENI